MPGLKFYSTVFKKRKSIKFLGEKYLLRNRIWEGGMPPPPDINKIWIREQGTGEKVFKDNYDNNNNKDGNK